VGRGKEKGPERERIAAAGVVLKFDWFMLEVGLVVLSK